MLTVSVSNPRESTNVSFSGNSGSSLIGCLNCQKRKLAPLMSWLSKFKQIGILRKVLSVPHRQCRTVQSEVGSYVLIAIWRRFGRPHSLFELAKVAGHIRTTSSRRAVSLELFLGIYWFNFTYAHELLRPVPSCPLAVRRFWDSETLCWG